MDGFDLDPEPSVRLARPLEIYREMELITGNGAFPVVATLHTLGGPADSTLLLFGLSLPTQVLRFQRDGPGFAAAYEVTLEARRDTVTVARAKERQTVRVSDFAETGRTDESVIFQTSLTLAPGQYALEIGVRDALSARGFQRVDTVAVPAYGTGGESLAPPLTVYQAEGRLDRTKAPGLVLNPRHTVPYGGESPLVYVETYGDPAARLEVRDVEGATVWSRDLALDPGEGVATGVVTLPVDSLPMGRFWLLVSAGEATARPIPFLVALSDQWLGSNFQEALDLLAYIARTDEVKALEEAGAEGRRRLWDEFWAARDPVPATPANEYRDTFFERIRVASLQFGEPGRPGWRTDRGEVYIVLGPPSRLLRQRYDERQEERYGGHEARAQEWVYNRVPGGGGLRLLFRDETGFGSYELTPESELRFRSVVQRIKSRTP